MRNHCNINAAFLAVKCFVFLFMSQATAPAPAPAPAPGTPPSSLLCISHCETCPVICSSPPVTPKPPSPPPPPPPPVHHSHPPPQPYYLNLPPPTPPSWVGAIPPPSVYVYNPGSQMSPQRNVSLPYYYFYASKAYSSSHPLHQGFIFFVGFFYIGLLMN